MKTLPYLLLVSLLLIACGETKKREMVVADEPAAVTDTTVYGKCADAANYTVLLELASGDTLEYIIPNDSDSDDRIVLGGLYTNDRLAIIAYRNDDGENIARRVINLTSLFGKWTDQEKDIDLSDGADWKILNGKILVDGDTFSIYDVAPDTLTLEDNDGIYYFERK